jgi:uncharacterized RDD family membrane protein YckC
MSNSTAAAILAPEAVTSQPAVDFSPEAVQAPFLLRLGSMIIDYMVLLVLPAGSLLYARIFGEPLGIMTERTLWFVSILLFLANIVILPLITGRSVGKLLTGLRVLRFDGNEPGIFTLLFRQSLGYLVTALTLGLGFFLCIFSSSGRTLHDMLTGTVVVRGQRRIV